MMSLFRFLVGWGFPRFFAEAARFEMLAAFGTGVRFDLLILGFLAIPLVLLALLFRGSAFHPKVFWKICSVYGLSAWTLISGLSLVDFLFFSQAGRRMTWVDWQSGRLTAEVHRALRLLNTELLILCGLIFVLAWVGGGREIFRAFSNRGALAALERKTFWRGWIVLTFLVALAARGTVTAHHLEWRHAERISALRSVQELALNPAWTWDKNPDR